MNCRVCGLTKPEDRFEIIKHSGNRRKICRECTREQRLARRSKDPEGWQQRRRATLLKSKYGISHEQYKQLWDSQGGVCKICKREETKGKWLSVDHCHNSLAVRGLLCHNCNSAIGLFEDNIDRLLSAIEYLGGG